MVHPYDPRVPMSILTKLAFAYLVAYFGMEVWHAVHNTLSFLGLLGAAIFGLGLTWRAIRRFRQTAKRTAAAVEIVRELPEILKHIKQNQAEQHRLGAEQTKRLDAIDKRFRVLADADTERVKNALAGDQRNPVDRRST